MKGGTCDMKIKSTTAAPLLIIAVFGLLTAVSLMPENRLGMTENPYLSVVILQLIIFALPTLFFCTLRGSEYRSRLRLRMPPLSSIPLLICAFILVCAGSSMISYFLCRIAPETMERTAAASYVGFAMTPGLFDGMYLVFAFALLPAITEEFLFRGVILAEYEEDGILTAVLMSSLTFAMVHSSPVRLPIYIFSALVLAAVAYAARSTIAAMIVHCLYNVFVIFFEDYIRHVAEKQNISGILLIFLLAGVTIISASIAAFEASSMYRTYASDNIQSGYIQKGKAKSIASLPEALLSPAFLLLIVFYVVMTIVVK